MNEQKDNSGETFFVSLFTLRNQFTMINLHKKVSPVPLTSETHKKTHSVSSEKRTKILSTPFQNNNYFLRQVKNYAAITIPEPEPLYYF